MNLEYSLLSGRDINLDCGLIIKQYSIDEIEEVIGYSNYEFIVWSMSRYNYEFEFDLEEVGVDYSKLSSYDIFTLLIKNLEIEKLIEYLNFIFNDNFTIINGTLISISKEVKIDSDSIDEIKEVFSKMFFFSKPKKRKPANEKAKELIKKQIKMRKNKKVKYNIFSIMHSLVWSRNSNETYDTIINKTPYQIYAGFQHIEKINKFDNTIDGIYAGVIKKDDVNFNNINWINKIDI